MDKFLDGFDQPKLNKEDVNHLNRSKTSNGIEAVIKSLPRKKSPGPNELIARFYQTFKEELIPILLKVFHELDRGGMYVLYEKGSR
jgi:hypothetical protein